MKRILVAVDQSPRASTVLAQAALIARATGAELYLFHAIGLPAGLPADTFRSSPTELVEQWRAASQQELEKTKASLGPDLAAHAIVAVGSPWAAICKVAREKDVDLVVIGSHGYDVVDHVLGTTAAKVVNHADRSVLVVRQPRETAAA